MTEWECSKRQTKGWCGVKGRNTRADREPRYAAALDGSYSATVDEDSGLVVVRLDAFSKLDSAEWDQESTSKERQSIQDETRFGETHGQYCNTVWFCILLSPSPVYVYPSCRMLITRWKTLPEEASRGEESLVLQDRSRYRFPERTDGQAKKTLLKKMGRRSIVFRDRRK